MSNNTSSQAKVCDVNKMLVSARKMLPYNDRQIIKALGKEYWFFDKAISENQHLIAWDQLEAVAKVLGIGDNSAVFWETMAETARNIKCQL